MIAKKAPLACAISVCLALLSSPSFANETDGIIDQPGMDLSTNTNWSLSGTPIQFGGNDENSPEIFGFQMNGGSAEIGEGTLLLKQVSNSSYGIGFLVSEAKLQVKGNLDIQATNPTMFVAALLDSEMSVAGNLKIVATSPSFPMHGIMVDSSTLEINHLDFLASGAPTSEGVPGLPHSGVTFINASNSAVTIKTGVLDVGINNVGPVVGFRADNGSTVILDDVFLNLINKTEGVTAIEASDSYVDLGTGNIKIRATGQVKAIDAFDGQVRKTGGTIDLESSQSDITAISASNAELSDLDIKIKSASHAYGLELVGKNSVENTTLTINSGGATVGVSIAGNGDDNLLKLNRFSLNIESSAEQALGIEINRDAEVSNSSIEVNSSKTAIGIVVPQGETALESVRVVAKGGEDSYALMRTAQTNFGTPVRGHLTIKGENYFEAANALGAGRGQNYPAFGDTERGFILTVESGITVFNGKINEFQGTFNATGGTTLFSDTTLNGDFNVGNATVVFGDIDSNKINSLKAENDLSEPLLYVAKPLYLLKDSKLVVGTPENVTTKTGVTLNRGSTTIINGDIGDNFVFNSEDPNTTFTVDQGATILADNITAGKELRVANFATELVGKESAVVKPVSRLLQLELKTTDNNQLVLVVKPSDEAAEEPVLRNTQTLIPSILNAVAYGAQGEGANRVWEFSDIRNGLTDEEFIKEINSLALMGAASGAQSVALTSANYIIDTIESHGSSFNSYRHKHRVMDLWIDLNGSFAKIDNYSAGYTRYGFKSDMSGISMGGDYSFGNGFATGLAFSFGKGSVRGQNNADGLKNKVEYYGVNGYGVWTTDYANVIGSVGYLLGHNKIRNQGFEGKPKSKIISLGVRVEKPIAVNDTISITPHLGLRYKHVKLDGFDAGGFKYWVEKANILETPIGLAANANMTAPYGAKLKPYIDLTITPNFGDKKVRNKVSLIGSGASDSFEGRIANSALYNAKIGVTTSYKSHSLALNYGIGGGNYGRVDQTLQAKYRFEF